MTTERKNRIGLIGFGVLFLIVLVIGSVKYWPTFRATLASKKDVSTLSPTKLKDFVASVNMTNMTANQKAQFALHVQTRMEQFTQDERRAMMSDVWGGFGRGRRDWQSAASQPATQPAEVKPTQLQENMRALMQENIRRRAKDYAKMTPDQRSAFIDSMMGQRGMRMGGRGGFGGGGGGGNPNRPARDSAIVQNRRAVHVAENLITEDADVMAGGAQMRLDMQAKIAQMAQQAH